MERVIPIRTAPRASTAALFILVGLVIYALLFAGSEWLVYRNGRLNPVFKIDTAVGDFDWVVLGASHAMPLDFGGFNAEMERSTGKRIINLAGPGTGPLYNRFVLEHFLHGHKARNLLYVADGFAFRAPLWNEDRFSDRDLLGRTPFHPSLAVVLTGYVIRDGVDPTALIDYLSGFSKLNSAKRFRPDLWEGEASFHRTFKPSSSAEKKRADYLYPAVADEQAARARYLNDFMVLAKIAESNDMNVTVIKMPLPPRFKSLLSREAEFDAALASLTGSYGIRLLDYSDTLTEPRFYADTDHLNRAGVMEFFESSLRDVLVKEP